MLLEKKAFWERPRDVSGRFMSAEKAVRTAKLRKASVTGDGTPKVRFGKDHATIQIYSSGCEFAFMSKVKGIYTQVCTFVHCKDFLHDAVWAWVNQTNWSIFGFTYNSSKHLPIDKDNCVFALRNSTFNGKDEEFHSNLEGCREFLNGFELEAGFEASQIFKVKHPKSIPCWLIIGDKRWQHAPPLVGLYTLLIRVGITHEVGASYKDTLKNCKNRLNTLTPGAGKNDWGYIRDSWKGIEAVLKHGTNCFHSKMENNYPKDLPKKTSLHDGVGPVNWTRGICKKGMPRWYKYL